MRPRTLWRLRVIVGVTLASAIAGGIYGGRFAPEGANVGIGALIGAFSRRGCKGWPNRTGLSSPTARASSSTR